MPEIPFADYLSSLKPGSMLMAALILIGTGLLIHFSGRGLHGGKTFSKSVYTMTLMFFLYWIIFVLSLKYGPRAAIDLVPGGMPSVPIAEYFPNPFDTAAMAFRMPGLNLLRTIGRIWLIAFLIELFTTLFMDLLPPAGLFLRYAGTAAVVFFTILINSLLVNRMDLYLGAQAVNDLFSKLLLVVTIGTLVLALFALIFPMKGFLGGPLAEVFLAPTFATIIAMVLGMAAEVTGWRTDFRVRIHAIPASRYTLLALLMLLMLFLWVGLYDLLRKK